MCDRTGKENVGSLGIYEFVCVSACDLFLEQIGWDIQKICSSLKIEKKIDYKIMQNRIKNKSVRIWIKINLMIKK